RRSVLAGDQGKTAARIRHSIAGSRRRASLKGPLDVLFQRRARALDGASHPGGDLMNPVCIRIAGAVAFAFISAVASAADYPAPKEGGWGARGFRVLPRAVIPALRLP